MREHAVILTYPGHFYLTQITINSLLKYIKPKDITIIVDDISYLAWPGYALDCKLAYSRTKQRWDIDFDIITTSSFDFLKPFEGNPWVRQQMVKLNLHKILPFDKWFFSDGDVEFCTTIPENITPYTIHTIPLEEWEVYNTLPLADRGTELMANYINNMLGLTDFWELPAPIIKEGPNRVISTSAVPFRDMNAPLLSRLEQFLTNRFHKTLTEIHLDVIDDPTQTMTEWELMEAYRLHILGEKLDMTIVSPQNPNSVVFANDYHFLAHFLPDSKLGADWFRAQGIEINDEFWQKIPEKRY